MPAMTGRGKRRQRGRGQKGGIFPLLALAIPALIAAGKAAAIGGISAAGGAAVNAIANKVAKKRRR